LRIKKGYNNKKGGVGVYISNKYQNRANRS